MQVEKLHFKKKRRKEKFALKTESSIWITGKNNFQMQQQCR